MALLIRLASAADSAALARIYRPYVENSQISFEEEPPDAAEMARRMDGELHPWLIAEEDDKVLGYAASSAFRARRAYRWSVETGIYLSAEAKGRGIGRELLSSLIELLERQGFVAAIGAIALPNPASVRLHEALGFVHAGTYRGTGFKMGEWLDVGLWQRELAPRTPNPVEPLPFAAIAPLTASLQGSAQTA